MAAGSFLSMPLSKTVELGRALLEPLEVNYDQAFFSHFLRNFLSDFFGSFDLLVLLFCFFALS